MFSVIMTDQIPALCCEPREKSAASLAPSEIWASPSLSETVMEFIEIPLKVRFICKDSDKRD